MNDQEYNGWNNYETWLTALWIDNDYSSYQYRCELLEQVKAEHQEKHKRENCLASNLRDWIESQNPITDAAAFGCESSYPKRAASSSLFTDLINSALSEVDWQEIAENFLSE